MRRGLDVRATGALRRLPLAGVPRPLALYLATVETGVFVWAVVSLTRVDPTVKLCATLALLIVLALGFEEAARRAARLKLRLSSDLKQDMTSVWAVAAAIVLPGWATVILLSALLTYIWFRHQRPAGQPLYRTTFTAASVILAALTASAVVHAGSHRWAGLPWALAQSVSVLVAILVFTCVNRSLITVALRAVGVRGRALLGSRDENMTEFATLCLGGLVSLAASYEPWLCILAIAPMVSLQRGALVRELETAATTDAKTGLPNAVAWELLTQREIVRATRENSPLAVVIIDIDRFKHVNDNYGHLVGDKVLRGIGRCLAATTREYDTVARFGGEEFVAVLPNASESDAMVIAERLRSRVNQLQIADLVDRRPAPDDQPLAVSIGVACFPADGDELPDLLHAADQALYKAKAMGRNRVQLAHRGGGLDERVTA